MWDDVIIGKGTSSTLCFDLRPGSNCTISENEVSYWISDVLWDMSMTAFKDTPFGKQMGKLIIKAKESVYGRRTLLTALRKQLLENISPTTLFIKVNEFGDQRYQQGRSDKTEEIRKVLFNS